MTTGAIGGGQPLAAIPYAQPPAASAPAPASGDRFAANDAAILSNFANIVAEQEAKLTAAGGGALDGAAQLKLGKLKTSLATMQAEAGANGGRVSAKTMIFSGFVEALGTPRPGTEAPGMGPDGLPAEDPLATARESADRMVNATLEQDRVSTQTRHTLFQEGRRLEQIERELAQQADQTGTIDMAAVMRLQQERSLALQARSSLEVLEEHPNRPSTI